MVLTRTQKQEEVDKLKERFDKAVATVILENRGLSADDVLNLRRKCREAGVEFKVSKNRLVRIAVQDTPLEGMADFLQGPNGIAYSYEDPVAPAKVIDELAKELDKKAEVKGGSLYEEVMPSEKIKDIAKMPSHDEIMATILGGIQGPATNIAYCLQGMHQKLAGLLSAYADKLEEGGEAA